MPETIENIAEPKIDYENNQFSELLNLARMPTYFMDEKIKYKPGEKIICVKKQSLITSSPTLSQTLETLEINGWKLVVA
ncbi:MAG: hypothetical protein AB8W37_07170 [Arsenophonus endosymbiont of Dermacentor nuttalli]